MTSDLSTTNVFLGIIALVSVLQVVSVVALAVGGIDTFIGRMLRRGGHA